MRIAIYGAGNYGQYVYSEIVNHRYASVMVNFWIDNFTGGQEVYGLPVYSERNFILHRQDEVDAVVIAIDREDIAQKVAVSFLCQGYDKIYLALPNGLLPQIPILNEDGELGSLIKFYKDVKPIAPMILVLVTNYCNLNCKRCAHYSNLTREKDILDLDKFESYLVQLKMKFKDILRFQLLGGEPLLNPQLDQYMLLVRKYFPGTKLEIVTNGLILKEIPPKLIDSMRLCNAYFLITQYPQIRRNLDTVICFLENEEIHYEITPPTKQFRRIISLKEENGERAFAKWSASDCICHAIEDGRVYLCPCIPKLYSMRDYFGIHIDVDELITSSVDLMDKEVDGWDILKYFNGPTPLCRYCSPDEVLEPWGTGFPHKEDWIID